MAVTYPRFYKEMYCSDMEYSLADNILAIREQEEIIAFKRMIFNFSSELVLESIDTGESIRRRFTREGRDFEQYCGELRPYQTVGAAFMYMSPRSILGDAVGVGKTVEISALLNYLKGKNELSRFLMAVETTAVGQTVMELIRFTGMNVIYMPSDAVAMRKLITSVDWATVDGVVIKHSALRSDVLSRWLSIYLMPNGKSAIFNTFILDESSIVKNTKTKTAQYTDNICRIVDRVHFMNATTFETSIMDIYNQMDMIDDKIMPKKWRIEKEYCTFTSSSYWKKEGGKAAQHFRRELSGYKNQEVFKESLKLVYLARSKKDVGKELPHTYLVYEIEPTQEQLLAIGKGYRYSEVLNSPITIPELDIKFNNKEVPKLERLISLMENEFQNDKVMIYCFHIEAQYKIKEALEDLGRRVVVLNGDSSDEERLSAINQFNGDEKDVIITNIQKSLNLYSGDVCIFYSMVGNPARMEQIRGRIDRSVDDRLKTYVLLVYKGTDEYRFFTEVAKQRAIDSRELTIDTKTAVDFFIDAMELDNRT